MSETVKIELTFGPNDLLGLPRPTFDQAKAFYDQCVSIMREQTPDAVISPCPQWILDAIERGEGSRLLPSYEFEGPPQ